MVTFATIVFSLVLLLIADRPTKSAASSVTWMLAICALVAGIVALVITSTE